MIVLVHEKFKEDIEKRPEYVKIDGLGYLKIGDKKIYVRFSSSPALENNKAYLIKDDLWLKD